MNDQSVLISRIDAIGDVTLTIPMCGYLKSVFPNVKIFFLGRSYTQPVINACSAIDHFINYNELSVLPEKEQISFLSNFSIDVFIHVFPEKHLAHLAKKAGIPLRIGTSHRWYNWLTCNKLIDLGRRKSSMHEAELNLRLLKGIGLTQYPPLKEIHQYYQLTKITQIPANTSGLLSKNKFNLILHPKSHGSGKEWPLACYKELIDLLPEDKFNVFVSGSEKERDVLKDWIATIGKPVNDISGLMSLSQLIAFMSKSDGLIACSTGPLHLAAALGINALGLYPDLRPLHAERWGPVGKHAEYLKSEGAELDTIEAIEVYERIINWLKDPD
jgi:heptosyltransferase-3